jgi:hypothetical protein
MGGYRFPWVRLHALRDYFGMAHLVAQHPGLHLTINFSPILLWQLDEYAWGQGADRALVLTRTPTARLREAERREVIETFFDADWHHQIYPHARYRGLLEKRFRNEPPSDQDITDLKMWFNLAWFGIELRTGQVLLPDGRSASVQRFVLCQPYRVLEEGGESAVTVLFRSRRLSDAIGFEYGGRADADEAAEAFLASVKALGLGLKGDRDHLVTVILDGENAWGGYRDDGRPFLHALYRRLASDQDVKTVTVSEYLDGNSARRLPVHPATEQTRAYELFTGSWIDSGTPLRESISGPGSASQRRMRAGSSWGRCAPHSRRRDAPRRRIQRRFGRSTLLKAAIGSGGSARITSRTPMRRSTTSFAATSARPAGSPRSRLPGGSTAKSCRIACSGPSARPLMRSRPATSSSSARTVPGSCRGASTDGPPSERPHWAEWEV